MGRVVLVNPPLSMEERLYPGLEKMRINYPPLGLCYLAAVLKEAGFEVRIFDFQIQEIDYQEAANKILNESPTYIGITSTTVAINNAAHLAKTLKEKDTQTQIILGGPHVSALPIETMKRFSQFDVGVIGEGEETVLELLNVLEEKGNLDEVRGLVIRKDGELRLAERRDFIENLDTLPLPAWDLLPDFSNYGGSQFIGFETRLTFRLITSRGCPFHCTFCDRNIFGNRYRMNSVDYILKMIKELYFRYGVRHIYFSDDNFTTSKTRTRELCRRLEEEHLDLTWDCNTRLDQVDLQLLKEMKRAGCQHIAYGIESGNQKILNLLKKGTTLKQIERALQWTKDAGIDARGNFMLGNPGETKETIEETIEFAKRLPLNTFKMSFFTPFPATEIYKEIEKYGRFDEDWEKLSKYSPVFIPHGLTQKDLERYFKMAYRSFYFRPKMVVHYLKRIKNLKALRLALKNFIILLGMLIKPRKREAQRV
ncbi:MAG: radical SAM protein [Candidatus Omnitrophica bacterium]|nr:radical SAM protein [Candidatus Omnitrophota bacterium]